MPRLILIGAIVAVVIGIGVFFRQKNHLEELKRILRERDKRIAELERLVSENIHLN